MDESQTISEAHRIGKMCKFKLMKGGSRTANKYGLTWLLGLLASSQAGFNCLSTPMSSCFQHLDSGMCHETRPSK